MDSTLSEFFIELFPDCWSSHVRCTCPNNDLLLSIIERNNLQSEFEVGSLILMAILVEVERNGTRESVDVKIQIQSSLMRLLEREAEKILRSIHIYFPSITTKDSKTNPMLAQLNVSEQYVLNLFDNLSNYYSSIQLKENAEDAIEESSITHDEQLKSSILERMDHSRHGSGRIGRLGEEFAKIQLTKQYPESVVVWENEIVESYEPYDLSLYSRSGILMAHVEVKTTSVSKSSENSQVFEISINEVAKLRETNVPYWIARVYASPVEDYSWELFINPLELLRNQSWTLYCGLRQNQLET